MKKMIEDMSSDEQNIYDNQSTSDYFRFLYYSEFFTKILDKLDVKSKLSKEEWEELLRKLYLVTCKAISEEDSLSIMDKLRYSLSKILIKISRTDGPMYSECFRMIEFVKSIDNEKDINLDLLEGFAIVSKSMSEEDLLILINQQREASAFRDNQDSFCIKAIQSSKSSISESERISINLMNRAYLREKELVKEYK